MSSQLPVATERPGGPGGWSPISCTLIQGDSEAVLVDTPISVAQTEDLVRWITDTAPGKDLKYIYITHGHGDHWFGIAVLQKFWPNVRAIVTPGTVAHMKQELEPATFNNLWLRCFPGNRIPEQPVLAEPMDSDTFQIEGHDFRVIEVGHTDTYDTTVLHVPSLHLVVAGDVVYGDVHQFFGEANTTEKRKEWLHAIDIIGALNPHTVIAGHKRPGTVDGLFNLRFTREYILAFEDAVRTASTWEEVWKKMVSLYPGRINPNAVVHGAKAAFDKQRLGNLWSNLLLMNPSL